MKIAIFGGTFDPPHIGHLQIIEELTTMDYDQILVMPTRNVDYKVISTDCKHRLNMLELLISQFDDRVQISDMEINRPKTTYTYETVKELQANGMTNIHFVLGTDSLNSLNKWQQAQYLQDNLTFILANRPGCELTTKIEHIKLNNTYSDITSSSLRAQLDINYLTPEIFQYIIRNNLYNGFELQKQIVSEMKVNVTIDANQEVTNRCEFIKKQIINSNTTSLVLGISGGQDSTLLGKLAQLTVNQLNAEFNTDKYKFIAVRLPYGQQFDEQDCQDALNFIQPSEIQTVNIKDAVDNLVSNINCPITDFNKGNIKARIRMVSQYAIAGANQGLVLGTDHSAENITGFFTKFGDGACDLAPLFGLNKRQGKVILQHLNCPSHLYTKDPTADLEDEKQALPDTVALGVTYDEIDDYLEGKFVKKDAQLRIEHLYNVSQHKRKPIPIID